MTKQIQNTTVTPAAPSDLQQRITALAEQGKHLAEQASELQQALLRNVKGTREQVAAPRARRPTETLPGEMPASDLFALVERLITERPMRFGELCEATQIRGNRISGALVHLQRHGKNVINLGDSRQALWFIPNDALLKRLRRGTR